MRFVLNKTMTSKWVRWCLKSPTLRLITQTSIQAQIKENIKAPRLWPLWGVFTDDRWIPRTKGQYRGKCSYLMTSSCSIHSLRLHNIFHDDNTRVHLPVRSTVTGITAPILYVATIVPVAYLPPASFSRSPSYGSPHIPHFPPHTFCWCCGREINILP